MGPAGIAGRVQSILDQTLRKLIQGVLRSRDPAGTLPEYLNRHIQQHFEGLCSDRDKHIEPRVSQKAGIDQIGFSKADCRQVGSQLRVIPKRDSSGVVGR
jgi:hypothetical protein